MIDGPLKADGRLAAKNATKIRAALTQVTNFKSVFDRYQETQPQPTDNRAKDRARARAWIMLNVGFNNEALHTAIMHAWAEAYVLGEAAANVWIIQTRGVMKAPITGAVNWDTWKPGDRATALLVKPVGGFKRYLEQSGGASYFKKFDKETTEMLGTALADAIAAGLDSEAAALLMKDYVGSAGRALTIAITEQNRAMSFSTIQRYKEADLQKMEWHVSDPCDICKQNAGVVINIGSAFPSGDAQPPAHPHCRCVLLPVIPGMEEDTGIDGTVTSPTMSPDGTLETPTDENYRGFHRAPTRADEFGSPATDVREMMPDFYEKPHIYTTGMDTADKESLRVLQRIKDKPEEMVTIYRAVPHGVNQINPGDWVTLSPSYAETHLAGNVQGGGHVISMQIRAKDLWFDGDSINEFGYDPVKDIINDYTKLQPIDIDDNTTMANLMNKHTLSNITEADKLIAQDYTSGKGYYSIVNTSLREPQDYASWASKSDIETAKKMVTGLDKIINETPPLQENLLTFRGIWGQDITKSFLDLKPGDTFSDAGYVSTSIKRAVADRFARTGQANAGVIMEIVNPAGTKGFFPLAVRTKVTEGLTTGSAENEWVLPRGTQFEVVSVDAKNKIVRVVVK